MKVKARIQKDRFIIDIDKANLLPAFAYYILEAQACNELGFINDKSVYLKEDLKGKKDWKDVKEKKF